MNIKLIIKTFFILLVSLIISSCGTRPLLLQTPTPTTLLTATSQPTKIPTPFVATFDDNLCEIKGSFILDGELCYINDVCINGTADSRNIEGSPSYALGLLGYYANGDSQYLSIWIKHSLSPKPNEMQTLPNHFEVSDIKIYTSNNAVLQSDLEPVRLKVHVIPAQITEPGADAYPLLSCDYVVEEIQLR